MAGAAGGQQAPAVPREDKSLRECGHCGAQVGGSDREGKLVAKLLACGRCRAAHYCSAECQRSAWPAHKKECKKKE